MIFETYQPDHYAVRAAAAQDYPAFYEQEMAFRRVMHYPPAQEMLAIRLSSKDEKALYAAAQSWLALLKRFSEKEKNLFQIIGPADAYIYRVKDVFRKQILVKCPDTSRLSALINGMEGYVTAKEEVSVIFDRHPVGGI